jgi:cell division protein FtsQ
MRARREEPGPWRLVHVVRRRVPARRLRPWGLVAVALAVISFGVVWATPMFALEDVRVSGTSVLDPAEVAAAADEYRGQSVLRVDLEAIAAEVASLPAVKSVDVSRSWPTGVRIEVTERDPYIAVPSGEETFLMVDSEGVVFDEVAEIPESIWNVQLDTPGPGDPATEETVAALQSLPSDLADKVERVETPSAAAVTLYLEDGRTVAWGDGSQSEEKTRVALRLLESGYEHVDVSAPDAPSVS